MNLRLAQVRQRSVNPTTVCTGCALLSYTHISLGDGQQVGGRPFKGLGMCNETTSEWSAFEVLKIREHFSSRKNWI